MLNKFKSLRHSRSEEGFTLVELMIVIVIIGILAAIAIPIFANQQRSAVQAGIKSDVKHLQIVISTYLVKHPTAVNLGWRMTSSAQQPGFPLNDDPDWQALVKDFKPSAYTTIITVREGRNKIESAGTWESYTILGANNVEGSSNKDYYRYYYYSDTGQYEEVVN